MLYKKILEKLGIEMLSLLEELGHVTGLFFQTISNILKGKIKPRLILVQMVKIGIDSIPIAITSAFFIGMVFAVQIGTEFLKFGAAKFIGGVMGIAIARELAPALTGIVVASRIAAAMTAEIGTMKVTEQIDALQAMGSNPVRYLVGPRFIACTCMLPLLTVLADLFCFLGGYLVVVYLIKVNSMDYLNSAQQLLTTMDIYGGILKSLIFGMLISIVACYKGLKTQGGAKGVGEATTSSVVTALLVLFIFNYFLSVLLFK
ncbi:hypothetical protein A3J90_08440 [candidate division WOR-1 bacterium RIFOXYC2_FULL_37_10]|uniref:ABC transporter permease n=1 Tax=candidate division WOR-1 bacterium RIFOXYB2_FULL_37_13 TaxID=1802579 RepID=A0A1F4SV91_UNCSA|nr:MAG: hypothetical protein A2246_01475 [candidate division WOR-1 bacterium RIFOXYA2_FULL_37_7]OGC24277.1 MAG: hypothetical protein A2310_08115 [candidate division WOR-1 bacterium RIFOXYB2_FULL_37_13]OGC36393.1 MAG: hypothetical protein A3J90_08440 [candidate division WOR-1 bacterium RIFOXYC2_FULL_37_10]